MSNLAAFDISTMTPDLTTAAADQDPLVSIIIPCYNGEAFLRETLESAVRQTYPRVEVIVIDDGSTDRSGDIALEYPVRYIRQPNRGLTPSRNLGIEESRGSYIVFLDADDRLKPEAIEIGLSVLRQHPECAMTVGDHLFVAADGSYLGPSRKQCLSKAHYEALLKSNFIEMISSVIFRKNVLATVGAFDTKLRVAEDYELYLRIARDHPICSHAAVVAEYRLHKTNASRNSELMLIMTLEVLNSQRPYVRGNHARISAFEAGTAGWRKQYGRQLTSEIARSYSTLRLSHLSRKLLILLGYYPQGLGMLLLLKILPGLDKGEVGRHRERTLQLNPFWLKLQAWAAPSKPHPTSPIG